MSFCEGQSFCQVNYFPSLLFAEGKKNLKITMLVLEVNPFAFEHLQSHVNIVDLLQAADGRQTEFGWQTPVVGKEFHHTPGSVK